jgi:predicted DNA-binding protein with PD1-like motif
MSLLTIPRLSHGVLAGLLLWAGAAAAQNAKASRFVAVKVHDTAGKAIPNAQALAVPVGGGEAISVYTDDHGVAYLTPPDGEFDRSVDSPGFRYRRKTYQGAPYVPAGIDVALEVDRGGGLTLESPPPSFAILPSAPLDTAPDETISPSRPIPSGLAPGMQVKLVKDSKDEKVYAVIFHTGDEALSGLTDFAIQNHIVDAHFTAIGAVRGATLGWLDLEHKNYHPIPVKEQCEVLSMMGDIATYNGRPVVHTHVVLGRRDGTTVGGHVWELHVNPTLEVFVTANKTPLKKRPDDASGMKFIDPTQ